MSRNKNKSLPSVKDLPISQARRESVVNEIIKTMEESAMGKQILHPVYLEKRERPTNTQGEFRKIGVNQIVDKIWFVEGAFKSGLYSHLGIGRPYGLAIAESETKLVLEKVQKLCSSKTETYQYDCPLDQDILHESIDILEHRGYSNINLITNIWDESLFWLIPEFKGEDISRTGSVPMGYLGQVAVFTTPLLERGITLLYDRTRLGELVIKEDIKCNVSEIKNDERSLILQQIPELNSVNLGEKARILAYEIISAGIIDEDAIVKLQTRSNPFNG